MGRAIRHIAAERIILLTLERGCKSAIIILADADLDRAAAEAVGGFTLNAGQVRSAGTRILVERSVYAGFVACIVPDKSLGPLISPPQFRRVQDCVAVAAGDGARPAGSSIPFA